MKNVFFAFRIMVGIGLFMIASSLIGVFLWWRKKLFEARWYLWPAQHVWWMGFAAIIAGWTVTESGRQPWLVYGILRTLDGVSPVLGGQIALSLALFVVVYGIVFSMGIYYINRLIAAGPKGVAGEPPSDNLPRQTLTAARAAGRQALGET